VKPSQALALHRSEMRELVAQNRARNPRIFGSVLPGRDTETSDLHVLVDPIPAPPCSTLVGFRLSSKNCWACKLIYSHRGIYRDARATEC
jgi:predicted nucleotidyltransferase